MGSSYHAAWAGILSRPDCNPRMTERRRSLGQSAEDAAAAYLQRQGLRLVARNVGFAHREIDLVCRQGDVLVFVEVKCRHARWGDAPSAAVACPRSGGSSGLPSTT